MIAEIRAKVKAAEPSVDTEFAQQLQDMIGDLTGAPQPVVVKLFSDDADALQNWAQRVADALGRIYVNGKQPIVDIDNGIDSTTSGPAVLFTVKPDTAAKAGFTTDQLTTITSAMVDGEPATTPVIINDRPYTLRVRYPASTRASLDAMNNTMLVNSTGSTSTLSALADVTELPGQTEILRDNLQREMEVSARLEGLDLGTGVQAVQKAVSDLKIPPSIRVEYGGTYQQQQKSFHDLVVVLLLALVLDLSGAAVRVSGFLGSHRDSFLGGAFDLGSVSGPADYANHVQRLVVYRPDHGGWDRGQERHLAARCEPEVPRGGFLVGRGVDSGGPPPAAADCDDGDGRGGGHAAACRWPSGRDRRCCSRWPSRSSAAS